jgi:membrane-associated phospholipid phosphatase
MFIAPKYLTLLFVLGLFINLNAQPNKSKKNNKHIDCRRCIHNKHIHKSPYKVSFKREIPYLTASAVLLGSGLFIKSINEETPFTVEELNNLDPNKINSFDRGAVYNNSSTARRYSDYALLTGALLPLYFLANHNTRTDFIPLLVMSAEVYAITSTLALNSKFAFNRSRPLAYNPEFSNETRMGKTSKLSFFSGHTAQTAGLSFFMAKVISDYHPNMAIGQKVGIWSFAVALPAVTGYLRVKGGKHFNTDVLTGYAIGAIIGWAIPHLHKIKESKLSLAPFKSENANGLTFTLKID